MTTSAAPNAEDLLKKIANRAQASPQQVKGVLDSFGVSLRAMPPTPRSINIHRLAFSGVKTGTASDGPFSTEFSFEAGVTAFVTEANLRGKSTILELITWLLRGTPRRLRSDVRPWLRVVTLEYSVNGTPLVARLASDDGKDFCGDLWAADDHDALASAVDAGQPTGAVRVLADGLDEAEFAAFQQATMLDRMNLEPITNWQKFPGSEEGRPQVNGWPAYFGAIYLPDANSEVLLGDVAMAGLPARLLQLFCNVPLMSAYIKCRTLQRQVGQDEASHSRRAEEDALARADQRKVLLKSQRRLQDELDGLVKVSARTAEGVRQELVEAELDYNQAADEHRVAAAQFAEATDARQSEARLRNNESETAIARLLFHGLSPKHCPRCETAIALERAVAEKNSHECAVCTTPIILDYDGDESSLSEGSGDSQGPVATIEEPPSVDSLQALVAAEDAAKSAAHEAALRVRNAEEAIVRLTAELKSVQSSNQFSRQWELELGLARVEGQLDSMPSSTPDRSKSITHAVLDAAADVLSEVTRGAASDIFQQLNGEITELGCAFGIENLDSVQLNGNGGMRVTTAGVGENFGKLSGGERLRLRIAVLIALLKIGHRTGIGTHPGLILLDSPGSEELATADERRLLSELDALKSEIPSLQICVTSAEEKAIAGVVRSEQVYAVQGTAPLW
jgi:hypothetical protein